MTRDSVCAAALYGLVLAGGRGTRLNSDKGELDYHGLPQARWALSLLAGLCERQFVSVRAEQSAAEVYRDLPLIVDLQSAGPGSGVRAAQRRFPAVAWLVIAADMPLLDRSLLESLVAARDATALATAFRHPDGTPEPLCAIWEPAARTLIDRHGEGISLRRVLEAGPAKLLDSGDASALASVNTPADDLRVRQRLRCPAGTKLM